MPTYLLNWNPRKWAWPEYPQEAASVGRGERVRRRWSTGVRKHVPVGSRVFLLRQGEEPRGIIASGLAVGETQLLPHFDEDRAQSGDTVPTTEIEFDALVDVDESAPLGVADLESPPLNEFNWHIVGGGVEIPLPIASHLERAWAEHLQRPTEGRFVVGARYTRYDVLAKLGLPVKRGGDPFTGYFRHGHEFFLFPNIGAVGSTGHDYDNGWEGEVLRWYGKTTSRRNQPIIQQLLSPESTVHLFTREGQRQPFLYEGVVDAESHEDVSPVLIRWRVRSRGSALSHSLDDLEQIATFREGGRTPTVTACYERSPQAREACIRHYGTACAVCELEFGEVYGELGAGFIHVHHLDPLGGSSAEREVDPVADLRPVCPNCHAMLHRREPPLGIDELRDVLQSRLRIR